MIRRLFAAISLTAICSLSIAMTVFADDPSAYGPGVCNTARESEISDSVPQRGASLGMFTTTGYCNCKKCNSGGHELTYSGTVPTAEHTISADLDLYPIGTRLMIGDIIYTVEDKGSHVEGSRIDVYYDNHEDAWNHGLRTEEVFEVIDTDDSDFVQNQEQ